MVSCWMCNQVVKPSWYTSHAGQLSLAIPLWLVAMSTSESWGVNRNITMHWPCICGATVLAGIWLRSMEIEMSFALRGSKKDSYFTFIGTEARGL